MDEPLEQFSFEPPWHDFITAFKFIAREAISRLNRWDLLHRLLVISRNVDGFSYHKTLFSRVTLVTERLLTT